MRTVLKLGGSVLAETIPATLAADAVARVARGEELVLVHGGGKALNRLMQRLELEVEFRRGLRVTNAETLQAAVMVLAGEVNTALVARLNAAGLRAVGLSGLDGDCVRARLDRPELGRVGSPCGGDPGVLRALLRAGFTPVLAPLAGDGAGDVLNVNADLFAAWCAAALGAERLIFTTDVDGVYDGEGATLPQVRLVELAAMEAAGAIGAGMLPKLDACRMAIEGGVGEVVIAGAGAAGTRVTA